MFNLLRSLFEQTLPPNLKRGKTKSLVDAIVNRHPVTFFYTGPRKPKKDSVKPGTRINAEVVALGKSKKGNLIVRAFVQEPSVSKKGFNETNWRTFIVNRMSNIKILNDRTFDIKRPDYVEGDESKLGPMEITYVTTDWVATLEPKTKEIPPKTTEPEVEPELEPEVEPETSPEAKPEVEPETSPEAEPDIKPEPATELPQPKIHDKPSPLPDFNKNNDDFVKDVYNDLSTKVKEFDGKKIITKDDYVNAVNDLYKIKERDWNKKQKELGKNVKPGTGTRKRFEYTSNLELSNELIKNNIGVVTSLPQTTELQENINRIKALILNKF